jgi:SAM-dependent methyltransferase
MTASNAEVASVVQDPALSTARRCPLCDADDPLLLHDNRMASIDRFPFSYPVVVCEACGMVYAGRALAPEPMGDYYRDLSKYSHGETSTFDRHRLRLAARFVRRVCAGRGRLLDVGCSTGAFLMEAVGEGMTDVSGIEPSPAAVAIARDRHGLDVQIGQAESFDGYRRFDIVTVLAVLEHLRDPARFLARLASQLASDAMLVFEVPDADAFGAYDDPGVVTEPFGEFSLEHINFFGVDALRRLGAEAGLTLAAFETNRLQNGGAALLVAFLKGGATDPMAKVRSTRTADSVAGYVERSARATTDIDRRLAALAARGDPVIVYGAGSHTARLLMRDAFAAIRVALIVDRNPHLAGRWMGGVRIASPDVIGDDPRLPVVISSFNASEAIVRDLRVRFSNEVVALYDVPLASRAPHLI